jgi:hypothetical protein
MKPTVGVLVQLLSLAATATLASEPAGPDAGKPRALGKGVCLLMDDHYVARSSGIERKVISPERFLSGPVVTGAPEHQNWQPFFTVLHDAAPAKRPFRMWYNADVVDDPADGAFFGKTAYLESSDGIRWPGPYERLGSLKEDGRVRFGANVIDEGPRHSPKSERYKMLYFDAGQHAGPRVAFSPDGLDWALHDGGKPVVGTSNGDDIWSAAWDPIRKRYFLFGKTFAPHTWTNAEGKRVTASIRRYCVRFSQDFKTWSEPKMVFSPDEKDSGVTQWYGPAGFLVRGDLVIGFLRVLRDDLSPQGVPAEAIAANTRGQAGLGASGLGAAGGSGLGYTVLTWTRDGETWQRDRHADKFFDPDPRVGAWDHAMAWVGSAVPLGDEVYLYYAGYRWGHKYHHSLDRQIGLVKVPRDRYVARQAGQGGGTLTTPRFTLNADALALNVDAQGGQAKARKAQAGEVRVQVTDDSGRPIPGFRFEDCQPIANDSLSAPVKWKRPLAELRGQRVHLELSLRSARLFALELQ